MADAVSLCSASESVQKFWLSKRLEREISRRDDSLIKEIKLSETKSQFARDDPAFLVLLLASLCRKLMLSLREFHKLSKYFLQLHLSASCFYST